MDIARFRKKPILGILRGIEPSILEPLIEAIASAGLETIEITMNTKSAPDLIRKAVKLSRKRLCVGAGTVLDKDSMTTALDAGASFIVMPIMRDEVVKYCAKNGIPVFPGALTPQEIFNAWNAGATMVKVFPSGFFGSEYFKEIRGPFKDIELLACGGVTPENMKQYFLNGANAIAFGASVFRKDWLEKKEFANIQASIFKFISRLDNTHHNELKSV